MRDRLPSFRRGAVPAGTRSRRATCKISEPCRAPHARAKARWSGATPRPAATQATEAPCTVRDPRSGDSRHARLAGGGNASTQLYGMECERAARGVNAAALYP